MKKITPNQSQGNIGEDEFFIFLKKLIFPVKTTDMFFGAEITKTANLYPIKIHTEDDHGQDANLELFWLNNKNKEPAGLHIAVQIKTYIDNPSFTKDDIEYFGILSSFTPLLIVWQQIENGNVKERKVINYHKITRTPLFQDRIKKIKIGEQDSLSFNTCDWENFDSIWCENYIRELLIQIQESFLTPTFNTLNLGVHFIEGILASEGFYFENEKQEKNKYLAKIYKNGDKKIMLISVLQTDQVLLPDLTQGCKLCGVIEQADVFKILYDLTNKFSPTKIIFLHSWHIMDEGFKNKIKFLEKSINCPIYPTEYSHSKQNVEKIKEYIN